MIPDIQIITTPIEVKTIPSRTYKIVFYEDIVKNLPVTRGLRALTLTDEFSGKDRISGYVDDKDSVIQAIYLILSTERYSYIIYSWDYGIELYDLIGQQMPYVKAELPRRIKESLLQDDRITNVRDFEFEENGKKLHTTFTVETNLGEISAEMEVAV